MKEKKFIVGAVNYGAKSATMKIYDDIDYWSADAFTGEFEYIESCGVKDLTIHINSMGGSVYDGLSIYNSIMCSDMKVTTIIDGVAMSMGSIIWAAGDVLKMRDIGILMIHNPFMPGADGEDKDVNEFIKYSKGQLRTIYTKRFGLSPSVVDGIMDGEEGIDGTYFTPEEAVKSGFLMEGNIIETPPIVVENNLGDIGALRNDKPKYARLLAKATIDEFELDEKDKQPVGKEKPIISQTTQKGKAPQDDDTASVHIKTENNKMEAKFKLVATAIGCPKGDENEVLNSINKLKASAAKAVELEKQVGDLKLEMTAKDTSIKNLDENLKAANSKLKEYEDKEKSVLEAQVTELIDKAIEDGKIQESARDTWVAHAKLDLEKAAGLLDSITPVVNSKITEEIAGDSEGAKEAEDARKTEGESLSARIRAARLSK